LLLVAHGDEKIKKNILDLLLQEGLKNRFIILSHRNDVARIMRAMDVFVFPSKYEGFGIVAIEAQIVGLKVLISDGVPNETMLTDQCFMLKLTDDINLWSDLILNKKNRNKSHKDINDFDIKNVIIKLEEIYKK
jgi:glycosyltransferase involved in cell wall biosynthesis